MKIDKLQIKLLIGLIFVGIIYVLILFLEPKENVNKNEINQKSFINTVNTSKNETDNVEREEIKNVTKEELFTLIEKNLQVSSKVELFMYSTEFFHDNNLANIFYEGEYKEVYDYIDLSKYKNENFKFTTLRNTENYIWGYFLEKNKEQSEKTYIIIDKLSGRLKSLNNKNEQFVFYYE